MSYMYMPPVPPPAAPPKVPLTPPVPGITTPPPVPLAVNGLSLSVTEFAALQKRRRPTRWLFWSVAVLGILFALSGVSLAYFYVGYVEGLLVTLGMLVALGAMFWGLGRHWAATKKAEEDAYRLHLAASEGGVITTFYPDRVTQHGARLTNTLTFSPATHYVETEELMILEDGDREVILRAADLTPEEAQMAYEYIGLAVPSERQFATGRFFARRTASTPPPFSTTPPVCYERFTYTPAKKDPFHLPAGLVWWLVAAALVLTGNFTTLFALTPFFLADFALCFALIFGAAMGLSLAVQGVWYKATPAPAPVTLSFTGVGLRIERDGIEQFVAAGDVKATRTENGARLSTPAGDFTFPWTATANRQQLEWMLFAQRPAPF